MRQLVKLAKLGFGRSGSIGLNPPSKLPVALARTLLVPATLALTLPYLLCSTLDSGPASLPVSPLYQQTHIPEPLPFSTVI